jgi:Zn-dependent oligopeptidase
MEKLLKRFKMKKSFLFTIATISLLNAGLFDFLGDKEEVKKESIVEKCTVLEKVLNISAEDSLHYSHTFLHNFP